MQELYVVYFESANYTGYGEYCLVWAHDEEDARDEASEWAEEFYRAQDSDQYREENGTVAEDDDEDEYDDSCFDGVIWASIMEVYPLASEQAADIRGYLLDDEQKQHYQIVNEKD